MSATESQIQSSIVDYLNLVSSCCFFHIPNGGYRNPREAAKLKRMGVKAGVPDLFLAHPNDHFHGLWVELKTGSGSVSKSQKQIMSTLFASGYAVTVIRSLEDFISCYKAYERMVETECKTNWLKNWLPKFLQNLKEEDSLPAATLFKNSKKLDALPNTTPKSMTL